MDYSLLFAVEYTEQELINQREELKMTKLKRTTTPSNLSMLGTSFFDTGMSKNRKKSSFKMTTEQQVI